jgi:hypothetical protein
MISSPSSSSPAHSKTSWLRGSVSSKVTVDAKSAPYAKHTASRTS